MIQKVGRGLMDRSNLEQLMCAKLEYFEAVYQDRENRKVEQWLSFKGFVEEKNKEEKGEEKE